MKRLLFIVLVCLVANMCQAKSNYIPAFNNRVILIDKGKVDTLQNHQRIIDLGTSDGGISISIVHKILTDEMAKAIKRAKSSAGWAAVAAGFSAASAGISQAQMNSRHVSGNTVANYVTARENTNAAISMSADAENQAELIKNLLVDMIITNNTEKELLINDMDRGLCWFILPHTTRAIPLENDEVCNLRISPSSELDKDVTYINSLTSCRVDKYSTSLETESFWFVPHTNIVRDRFNCTFKKMGGYVRIDKNTSETSYLTDDEFEQFKKEFKEQVK